MARQQGRPGRQPRPAVGSGLAAGGDPGGPGGGWLGGGAAAGAPSPLVAVRDWTARRRWWSRSRSSCCSACSARARQVSARAGGRAAGRCRRRPGRRVRGRRRRGRGCFRRGRRLRLGGPADLGAGVVACLVGGGQRGVPVSMRGAGAVAGSGEGSVSLPADSVIGVRLVADGLGAGGVCVCVCAGSVGGLERGLAVGPGGVHRSGGGLLAWTAPAAWARATAVSAWS